jgi:hypothetical protein
LIDTNHPWSDFRNFIYSVWKHLGLPEPTPIQYDIAHWLQHGPKRSGTEAFRGVGKSYETSAYAVWRLYWDCNLKIMVVSASKERADAFSQFCLRLIGDMPELRHMMPKSDQRRSLIAWDVAGATVDHSPSMKSVGITGQLTGSRADLIIVDDVETPKNSQTVVQREKLETLVTEFDAVLKPLATSRIIYLGTPQVEDSIYNKLAKKGYVFRIWPARKPSDAQIVKYDGKLAQFIVDLKVSVGSTTDPRRFSDADLAEREASYGRSGFALQFMLDTSLSDALRFPLRCSDLIVMDVDREIAPVKVTYGSGPDQMIELECVGLKGDRFYQPMYASKDYASFDETVMFIDPSGRGSDKTAVAVVKSLQGMLFIRRVTGMAGGYDDMTLNAIARLAATEKVNKVLVESNFGDGMFTKLLLPVMTRIHPCTIEDIRHSKQKELRIIDTLEPLLNQHRLVIDKTLVVADRESEPEHQLFHQLTRITRDRNALSHDDLLDALAGACAYFGSRMDIDTSTAEDRHKADALDKELEKFFDNVGLGGRPTRHNWTTNV